MTLLALGLAASLTDARADTYKVREGSSLNARSAPGTNSRRIDSLPPGTVLDLIEDRGAWARVRLPDGREAWVFKRYIEPSAGGGASGRDGDAPPAIRVFPQLGHAGDVDALAISPDGKWLLTGSGGSRVATLWDIATGREVKSFDPGNDNIEGIISVGFDATGERVMIGHFIAVAMWDLTGDRPTRLIGTSGGTFQDIRLNPADGLVAYGDARGRLFETHTDSGKVRREYRRYPDGGFGALDYNGDGALIATVADNEVFIHNTRTGQRVSAWTFAENGLSYALDLDRSGGLLALTSAGGTTGVRLHRAMGGAEVWSVATEADPAAIAFSPDESELAVGLEDGTLIILDAATGAERHRFAPGRGEIVALAYHPDGRRIALGTSGPEGGGEAVLVDAASGEVLRLYDGHASPVNTLAVAPGGGTVAVGTGPDVKLWDIRNARLDATLSGHTSIVVALDFDSTGKRLVSGSYDRTAVLWDMATGERLQTMEHDFPVNAVAFDPDDRLIATAAGEYNRLFNYNEDPNGEVAIWYTAAGRRARTIDNGPYSVNSVAFAPDGATVTVAAGGFMDAVRGKVADQISTFSVATGRRLSAFGPKGHVGGSVVYSPDGAYMAVDFVRPSAAPLTRVIATATGEVVAEFEGGGAGGNNAMAFSPDSRRIAIPGNGNTIEIRTIGSEARGPVLTGHRSPPLGIAYDETGRYLFTVAADATTRMWRAADGRLIASFVALNDGGWIILTPEGFFTGSPGAAKSMSVVRDLDTLSFDNLFDALYRPDLVLEALRGDPDGKVAAAAAALDLDRLLSSGLPPLVARAGLLEGARVDVDRGTVQYAVTAQDGGVGRIEIKVNGATQVARTENLMAVLEGDDYIGRQAVFLTPGRNEIEITAFNRDNLIASDPLTFTVDSTAPLEGDPTLYVLAVGVNAYADKRLNLTYAVNDARSVAGAIDGAAGQLYGKVVVRTLVDEGATAENLARNFSSLGRVIRPQDVFVFFLAGHGKTVDGRYYFIPHELELKGVQSIRDQGIDQRTWQDWFARIPAQKSVLFYDTCESGSLARDGANNGLEVTAAVDRLTRATGRTIITAATDTAPALEGYGGHGVFTYTLLEAIGAADADADGQLEVTELADYIATELPEISFSAFNYRQVPQASVRGDSFSLGHPYATLR